MTLILDSGSSHRSTVHLLVDTLAGTALCSVDHVDVATAETSDEILVSKQIRHTKSTTCSYSTLTTQHSLSQTSYFCASTRADYEASISAG